MNITGLILIVCLYPFVFIMYFLLKNEAEPKKGVYFGVTLSKEQRKTSEVEQISTDYQTQMRRYLWILMLMPIPMMFIPWFSIAMTYWMIWLVASCIMFFIPFGVANTKLKELKRQKGWNISQEQPIYTEIKEAGRIRKVKWYHFLLPNVISVVLFAWTIFRPHDERTYLLGIMTGSFAGITFLFWAVAVWMDKQKTQIISSDSDVNVNYARAKKNLWKNLWVSCVWVNVIYMVGMLLCLTQSEGLSAVFWVLTILYMVVVMVLFIWILRKKAVLDNRYDDKMDMKVSDADAHWIWGMFYFNPKDKHSMVEKRVGMGTTVNMATATGKGTMILLAVSLLSLPIICIWCILLEFTPIKLAVEENKLIASHIKVDHSIPLHSVRQVELLTELPKMSRNHGTSIESLKKGSYRIKEEETSCEVFLNPQNTVFIRVETSMGIYYFSGYDDEETRQVYEEIGK